MPSTNKLIGIALTGTGVIGASAGTYYALGTNSATPEKTPVNVNKSKISDLITASKRTLLDNDPTNLEIKFYVYEKLENKPDLKKNSKEGLKEWCEAIINEEPETAKKDEENSNFKIALNLCTKPTNKEKLLKNSKTLAGTGDWAGIQGKYASQDKNDNLIPTLIGREAVTVEDISNWCSKTLENEVVDSEHKLTELWCTKQVAT